MEGFIRYFLARYHGNNMMNCTVISNSNSMSNGSGNASFDGNGNGYGVVIINNGTYSFGNKVLTWRVL